MDAAMPYPKGMTQACHRCGGDLLSGNEAPVFCPHCAAPQLLISEACLADAIAAADTTGANPPPPPREIEWLTAIRCALLVAGIAVVLSLLALRVPFASFLSTVWVLTAPLTTLGLYQSRRPQAWMDAGIGARIGLTTSLGTVALLAIAFAAAGLISRFGLHSLGGFDATVAQLLAQARQASATSTNPAPPEALRLYDKPEFQAGLMMASLALSAVFLLVVGTCGGALGGLLRARRPARA